MSQNKNTSSSPFAAMSYQEQQDRWLEWRSRQLDYRPAGKPQEDQPIPYPSEDTNETTLPPVILPNLRQVAPTRHKELDKVLARHHQAAKRAGHFLPISNG